MINYIIFGKSDECDFYQSVLKNSKVRVKFLSLGDNRVNISEINPLVEGIESSLEFSFDKSLKFFFSTKGVGFLLALLMVRDEKINVSDSAGSTLFLSASNYFDIILLDQYITDIDYSADQKLLFHDSKFKNLDFIFLDNQELSNIISMDYESVLQFVYSLDNHIFSRNEILYLNAGSESSNFIFQDNKKFLYKRDEIVSTIINNFDDLETNQRNIFLQFLTSVKREEIEIVINTTVRSGIFQYYIKSIHNEMFNKNLFSDLITSRSKVIPSLKIIEELVYKQRVDLQIAFPTSKQGYSLLVTQWLLKHGIREENLEFLLQYLEITHNQIQDRKIVAANSFRQINFFGYFDSTLGLTEAAKTFYHYLYELKFDINLVNVSLDRTATLDNPSVETILASAVNIFSINSDNLSETMNIFDFQTLKSKYNIGIFFWEVEVLSDNFCFGLNLVDEIWTTSEYIKQILEKHTSKPIFVLPLLPNVEILSSPLPHLVPDNYFITIFDFFSDIDRKNPWTLIEAFKTFVLENTNAPHLIIKTLNSEYFPTERERLLFEIRDCSKIQWVDQNWNKSTLNLVIKNSKALFSMHRAEGFGLTIFEAMSLGTLTVATNYSGNLEFMNEKNSVLIDFNLVPIKAQTRAYKDLVGYWAQPKCNEVLYALHFISNPANKSKIELLILNATNYVNYIYTQSRHLAFINRRFTVIKRIVSAKRIPRIFKRLKIAIFH